MINMVINIKVAFLNLGKKVFPIDVYNLQRAIRESLHMKPIDLDFNCTPIFSSKRDDESYYPGILGSISIGIRENPSFSILFNLDL